MTKVLVSFKSLFVGTEIFSSSDFDEFRYIQPNCWDPNSKYNHFSDAIFLTQETTANYLKLKYPEYVNIHYDLVWNE